MAKKYYLVSSDTNEGYALNVPYKETYYKTFSDISYLDDACIKLGNDYLKGLEYANPGVKIYNQQHIINPLSTKDDVRLYSPYNIYNDRIMKLLERFQYFIDERMFKVDKKDKLELNKDYHLIEYIIYLLNRIYELDYNYFDQLISYDSTISKNIKSLIESKKTRYPGLSPEKYYDLNSKMFTNYFSSYTELRNATLMLIKGIMRNSIFDNSDLNKKRKACIYGMSIEEPWLIKRKIEEYYKVTNSKKVVDFVPPKEKYHQMTLTDYFGSKII